MMVFVLDGAAVPGEVALVGFDVVAGAVVSSGALEGVWLLLLQADSIRMIGQIA